MCRDDPRRIPGNADTVSHDNGEFSYYVHLQRASLDLRNGEMVERGDRVGAVGNGG